MQASWLLVVDGFEPPPYHFYISIALFIPPCPQYFLAHDPSRRSFACEQLELGKGLFRDKVQPIHICPQLLRAVLYLLRQGRV